MTERLQALLPTAPDVERAMRRIEAFQDRPLYIYGAGVYACEVQRFLEYRHVAVAGRCVDDQFAGAAPGTTPLSEVAQLDRDVNIVVGFCGDFARAEQALRAKQMSRIRDVFHLDCRFWERFSALTLESIHARLNEFTHVFELLEDQLSQQTFVEYLKAKLLFDSSPLRALRVMPQYFPDDLPAFAPVEDDVFADGGAFTGDTLASLFASGKVRRLRAYHGFEPDGHNADRLAASVATLPVASAHVHRAGLWSSETTVRFASRGNTTSSVDDAGGEEIRVVTIDGSAPDATFIKMDIEGAEGEALKGAASTIRANKPRLAIAAYHKPTDLLEIPRLIESVRHDYRFALRIHSFMSEELVLYAR